MAIGSIHGRNKFKGIQGLAAGVHLFKYDTYGFLGCLFVQFDDWNLVVLEILEYIFLKVDEFVFDTVIVFPVF